MAWNSDPGALFTQPDFSRTISDFPFGSCHPGSLKSLPKHQNRKCLTGSGCDDPQLTSSGGSSFTSSVQSSLSQSSSLGARILMGVRRHPTSGGGVSTSGSGPDHHVSSGNGWRNASSRSSWSSSSMAANNSKNNINGSSLLFTAVIYTQSLTGASGNGAVHHNNPLFKLVANVASSQFVDRVRHYLLLQGRFLYLSHWLFVAFTYVLDTKVTS